MKRRTAVISGLIGLTLAGAAYGAVQLLPSSPAGERSAAEAVDVVNFLRGIGEFDRLRLAPVVTLRLADEGGGTRVALEPGELEDPEDWHVRSGSTGVDYSFAPPVDATYLTVEPGKHLNCLESSLAARAPAVADLPHVGTSLRPVGSTSCLDSWNLTLLFDPDEEQPTVIGAVFDRWEW